MRLNLRFIFTLALVFECAGCLPATLRTTADYRPLPADLAVNYGLIGVRLGAASKDTVEILRVFPRSPASAAGLAAGDRLLAADSFRLRTILEASRYLRSLEPGSWTNLIIQRGRRISRVECRVTHVRDLYFTMSENGGKGGANAARHVDWTSRTGRLERSTLELAGSHGRTESLHGLESALRSEMERFGADSRLQDVHFALEHPLKSVQMTDALASASAEAGSLTEHLAHAAMRLDAGGSETTPSVADGALDRPSHIGDFLASSYRRATLRAEAAFSHLDSAARDTLYDGIAPLLESFKTSRYLSLEDTTEFSEHVRTIQLAKRVNLRDLIMAAGLLSQLATEQSLSRIRPLADAVNSSVPDSLPSGFRGDIRYAHHTRWGWILVGGPGDNVYGKEAAVIVDLGGDDLYLNNCGAPPTISEDGKRRQLGRVGLIIDLAGDDHYIGNRLGSIGSGLAGVGLLVDLNGDDVYQGTDLTQGAAFCGVGILRDAAGDDQYLAQTTAQGCGLFGAGFVFDGAGDDLYSSTILSQAFGGPKGLGQLLDRAGDDRYLADGVIPSSYGTTDVFQGWSQGVGSGLRGASSGGVGLLVDLNGSDEYQAGNFSQGTGYFFGIGMLVDRDGADTYVGSRYVQGTAAHQAVGVLIDENGNDHFLGGPAAAQGAAWDASVGILEDRAGSDRYSAKDLAQGAAAMNGVGILYDWAGADVYHAESGQGQGGSTSYWGGRNAVNFGVMMDDGGENDAYSDSSKSNGTSSTTLGVGLFLDR